MTKKRLAFIFLPLALLVAVGLRFIWGYVSRDQLVSEKEASLFQVADFFGGRTVAVPVELSIKATKCRMGDVNAIVAEAEIVPNSSYVLMFEPLLKGRGKPHIQSLSLKDITGGITTQINFSLKDDLSLYGISLCRDSSNEGTCHKKMAANIDDILIDYYGDPGEFARKAKVDKTYFHAFLGIRRRPFFKIRAFSLLEDNLRGIRADQTALLPFVNYLNVLGLSQSSSQILADNFGRIDQITGSMPLNFNGEILQIMLPVLDESCKIEPIVDLYRLHARDRHRNSTPD